MIWINLGAEHYEYYFGSMENYIGWIFREIWSINKSFLLFIFGHVTKTIYYASIEF